MKYYYCLIPYEDTKGGVSEGKAYAYANRDKWIEATDQAGTSEWQTGTVLGCEFVIKNQVAYQVRKSYLDFDNNWVVVICIESRQGCDTKVFNKSNTPLPNANPTTPPQDTSSGAGESATPGDEF